MSVAIKRYKMGNYHFKHIKKKRGIYLTKRRKMDLFILRTLLVSMAIIAIINTFSVPNRIAVVGEEVATSSTDKRETVEASVKSDLASLPVLVEPTERIITAYNVGDPSQTDSTPCISASGDNICNLLAQGKKICAANFVPLGTMLEIEGLGTCEVLDRMNARYADRIDWAMETHQKQEAINFGLKKLKVLIQ